MAKLTRPDVLRKCIIVFDALKRAMSRGNAGLEPERGAEESYWTDHEITETLREMLREMEAGKPEKKQEPEIREWQREIMENGPEGLRLL